MDSGARGPLSDSKNEEGFSLNFFLPGINIQSGASRSLNPTKESMSLQMSKLLQEKISNVVDGHRCQLPHAVGIMHRRYA